MCVFSAWDCCHVWGTIGLLAQHCVNGKNSLSLAGQLQAPGKFECHAGWPGSVRLVGWGCGHEPNAFVLSVFGFTVTVTVFHTSFCFNNNRKAQHRRVGIAGSGVTQGLPTKWGLGSLNVLPGMVVQGHTVPARPIIGTGTGKGGSSHTFG